MVSPLQEVLEKVEALPPRDRQKLVKILRQRSLEKRRARLDRDIAASRAAYARGDVTRGSAAEIARELNK